MKTLDERKALLEDEITKKLKQGWRIVSKTETDCQLIKDKKPSGLLVLLLFSISFLPGIGSRGTKSVCFKVNEEGEIIYTSKDVSIVSK
jgi:hypothetical protein